MLDDRKPLSLRSDEGRAVVAMLAGTQEVDHDAYRTAAMVIEGFARAAMQSRHVAVTTLDQLLEVMAPDLPEMAPVFTSSSRECRDWAEWAPDRLVLVMLAACLQRLERTPPASIPHAKRLMATLWNVLSDSDKRAFLKAVGA